MPKKQCLNANNQELTEPLNLATNIRGIHYKVVLK